jgi:hypothetical protein
VKQGFHVMLKLKRRITAQHCFAVGSGAIGVLMLACGNGRAPQPAPAPANTDTGTGGSSAQSWSFMVTRRVLIIDEEAGITWGMFPFQQSDSALVVGEAFKMMDGKIMMIQAVMAYIPAKAWD